MFGWLVTHLKVPLENVSNEVSRKQEEWTKPKVSLSRLKYVLCTKRFMVHLFTEEISVHFVHNRKHTEPDSTQCGNGSIVCIARTGTLKKKLLHTFPENRENSCCERDICQRLSPYKSVSLALLPSPTHPLPHYCSQAVLNADFLGCL